jgi:hypothetical protein
MTGSCFDYHFVPVIETWGDILVAWHMEKWSASHMHSSTHTIIVKLTSLASASSLPWWLTTIHGPNCEREKLAFLQELRGIRASRAWDLGWSEVTSTSSTWLKIRATVSFIGGLWVCFTISYKN